MSLLYWQPWQEIETFSRRIDQLLDERFLAKRNAASTQTSWTPAIELQATDTTVVLRAELPGVDAKDLDIQVTREGVAITGEYRSETRNEDSKFVRSEFRYGSFRRVVPLPVAVQNDQVKADFTDGILTLTLPKAVSDRPKVVKVNLTEAAAEPTLAEPKLETSSTPTLAETKATQTDDLWAEKAA